MKHVEIHTDGSCLGNPGPGGWAAVLRSGDHRREISGGFAPTTNNRMEIIAVLRALELLKEPCTMCRKPYGINGWKGGLPGAGLLRRKSR